MWGGAVAAAVALLAALAYVVPRYVGGSPSTTPGRVTIGTTPLGAEVTIDGQAHGLTPVTVQLGPGAHMIVLRRNGEERTIPLQVASGAEITQHYEFAPRPAPAPQTSTLSITSDPAGARVLIDGESRGVSPVTIADLSVARHRVTVIGENGTVERQVTTEAGVTSSLVVSLPKAPAMSAGWLTVASPFEVQVLERGEVIGTSAAPRFMVPAGAHEVELINDTLGYKERRKVDVSAGASSTIKVDAQSTISVNARPWAEVFVDGRSAGQTPIANFSVSLGSHQVIFRHPELGERQQTVVVTAKGANRIAVDLTK
jgi:serine/threonine-protein kinase